MNTSRLCRQETKAKIYWLTLVSNEHGWNGLAPYIGAHRGICASSVINKGFHTLFRGLPMHRSGFSTYQISLF